MRPLLPRVRRLGWRAVGGGALAVACIPTVLVAVAIAALGAVVMCLAVCFGAFGLLGVFLAEGVERLVCAGYLVGSPIAYGIGGLLFAGASALASAAGGFVVRFTRSAWRTIAD